MSKIEPEATDQKPDSHNDTINSRYISVLYLQLDIKATLKKLIKLDLS